MGFQLFAKPRPKAKVASSAEKTQPTTAGSAYILSIQSGKWAGSHPVELLSDVAAALFLINHAAWVLSCQFDLCKLLQPCFPIFSHFWSVCHGEVKSELPSRAKTRSARSARTQLRRNSKNFRENGNCRVQPVYILILFNIVAPVGFLLHLMFTHTHIYIYVWYRHMRCSEWQSLVLLKKRSCNLIYIDLIYIDDPWLHRLCQTIQCTPRPVFVTSPLRLFVNWLHVNESVWRWGGACRCSSCHLD